MMQQIANAPQHMRQAMLQQMMREQLGAPNLGGGPPQLAALPREQQQAVVQQLMSRMTPQQRHALLQMHTQQQAAVLQQYYQEEAGRRQQPAAVMAAAATAGQQLPPPAQINGHAQLASMLSNLPERVRAQLAAMMPEQQQALLARFLLQQQAGHVAQQLAQRVAGMQPQHGALPGGALNGGTSAGFLAAPTLPHQMPPSGHPSMAPLFALSGPPAARASTGLALHGGDLFPGENGMAGGMLPIASRAEEDALQDAVDFFLSD
jgi:hypothetical protein